MHSMDINQRRKTRETRKIRVGGFSNRAHTRGCGSSTPRAQTAVRWYTVGAPRSTVSAKVPARGAMGKFRDSTVHRLYLGDEGESGLGQRGGGIQTWTH